MKVNKFLYQKQSLCILLQSRKYMKWNNVKWSKSNPSTIEKMKMAILENMFGYYIIDNLVNSSCNFIVSYIISMIHFISTFISFINFIVQCFILFEFHFSSAENLSSFLCYDFKADLWFSFLYEWSFHLIIYITIYCYEFINFRCDLWLIKSSCEQITRAQKNKIQQFSFTTRRTVEIRWTKQKSYRVNIKMAWKLDTNSRSLTISDIF